MHYYSHNIGDYRRDTTHLSLLEHGVYRQLLDWYYLAEENIPEQTDLVCRRLCARTDEEKLAVKSVLEEFFLLDSGWSHKRCDEEINTYKAKAKRARINGKLGGRKAGTKVVISGNQEGTQTQANPLTHKPINSLNNKSKTPVSDKSPTDVSIVFDYWRDVMQSQKSKLDAKRSTLINKSLKLGYSVEELKSAINGCRASPHNMGINDRGTKFNGIDLIFRDADHIDRFIRVATEGTQNGKDRFLTEQYQRPDTSAAGQIRANVAREIAARASAQAMAAHGVDVRPQMGDELRAGSRPGQCVGIVLEGDFSRSD